jgi:hypothetical protein
MSAQPFASLTHTPSPLATRIGRGQMAFGIIGGPAAWFIQVCAGEALASEPCFPDGYRYVLPPVAFNWTWPALIGLMILCAMVALVALLVSSSIYLKTREEVAGEPGGGLMDEASGRTRFMALWGMLYGGGFCLITLFTLAAYINLPRCAG